jgi:hypothetical protein
MAVTALDVAFLNRFITNHIVEFRKALTDILNDDPKVGPPISKLSDHMTTTTIDVKKPLTMGKLTGEGGMKEAAELNEDVQKSAFAIQKLLEDHQLLFEDVEEALREVIERMRATQHNNLEGMPMDDFMDIFEDVESDLGGSSNTEGGKHA